MAEGIGRLVHCNGDVYEGEWIADHAEGRGKYYHPSGAIFDGQWKND